jgi:proteasome lid subunit RPN8/RPN11
MSEHEPPRDTSPPEFGEQLPQVGRHAGAVVAVPMFPEGDDLPLFSGTPIPVIEKPYIPEDHSMKQAMLPDMPAIDYTHVLENDRVLRRRKRTIPVLLPAEDIFVAAVSPNSVSTEQAIEPTIEEEVPPVKHARRRSQHSDTRLREAIEPYLDIRKLRQLMADRSPLEDALRTGDIPEDIRQLIQLLAVVVAPVERDQIKSPADIAAYIRLRTGHECQEQFCVVCLNTKNRVQKIHTVYQGSVNTTMIRVGEAYREPIKLNSTGVIFYHQHPSGDPTPSPEDVLVTRQLVAAGTLLDIECLDSLIVVPHGHVSLRERGLWPSQ